MMSSPPSWKYEVISKISVDRIYSKSNPAKFHPDAIGNDEALSFLADRTATQYDCLLA